MFKCQTKILYLFEWILMVRDLFSHAVILCPFLHLAFWQTLFIFIYSSASTIFPFFMSSAKSANITNGFRTHFCTLNSILQHHFSSELFLPLPPAPWPSQVQVLFISSVPSLPSAVSPCSSPRSHPVSFCRSVWIPPTFTSLRLFYPCFCLLHCLVLLLAACSVNNTLITICEERSEFLSDWTNDWGDGARMWILWMRKRMCEGEEWVGVVASRIEGEEMQNEWGDRDDHFKGGGALRVCL